MPKIPEFLQQIVNEACDEKSLPSGQCTDKAELTMLYPFLFPCDLNEDNPQPVKKKQTQKTQANKKPTTKLKKTPKQTKNQTPKTPKSA